MNRRKTICWLGLILILVLSISVQSAQDTLRPASDAGSGVMGGDDWVAVPSGDKYATIDEVDPNDNDHIYLDNPNVGDQCWLLPSGSGSGTIDSVWIVTRAKNAGILTAKIIPHRWYWGGDDYWYLCGGTIDTITTSSSYDEYITRFGTDDPCTGSAWEWDHIYQNGAYDYSWGVRRYDDTMEELTLARVMWWCFRPKKKLVFLDEEERL